MWIFYDHFSTFINITHIRLYTIYFDSTGDATALLSNYAATVSETLQEPWRSLSFQSTSCSLLLFISLTIHSSLSDAGGLSLHIFLSFRTTPLLHHANILLCFNDFLQVAARTGPQLRVEFTVYWLSSTSSTFYDNRLGVGRGFRHSPPAVWNSHIMQ